MESIMENKKGTSLELSSHFLEFASMRRSRLMTNSDMRISIYLSPYTNLGFSLTPYARILHSSKRDVSHYQYLLSNIHRAKKPVKSFCTGSRYIGEWGDLGFDGKGLYRFPHGVIYNGYFNNQGEFHGLGCLTYPNGQKLQGVWKNGKLQPDQLYVYSSGEYNDENLPYCKTPDRRFHVEVQNYFGQVGQEYLTSDQPTKHLPPGCYDVTYGIFNPETGAVTAPPKSKRIPQQKKTFDPHLSEEEMQELSELTADVRDEHSKIFGKRHKDVDDEDVIVDIPTKEKVKWIKKHCRKAWDEPTGYVPEFYKPWMTGTITGQQRQSVLAAFDMQNEESDSTLTKDQYKSGSSKLFSFIQKRPSLTGRTRKSMRRAEEERRRKTTAL